MNIEINIIAILYHVQIVQENLKNIQLMYKTKYLRHAIPQNC